MQGHLTLDRIMGPLPVPEFRDCVRCGIGLPFIHAAKKCVDCKGLNRFAANPRQIRNEGRSFLPVDPAYEIALHYPKQPYKCPTQATLDALGIPYQTYTATQDPIAFTWAEELFSTEYRAHTEYPIVVIVSYGEYLEHWTGFNLFELNRIPARRAATIQMSQTPHDFVTHAPVREMEAA